LLPPDTCTFNTTHGWNHDAQFVIRMRAQWKSIKLWKGSL